MHHRLNTTLVCLGIIAITGCTTGDKPELGTAGQEIVQVGDGTAFCRDLRAGKHTDAGDVCVHVDGSDLIITYTTTDGWELDETHTWAGRRLRHMPQTRRGKPKIGHFPYHSGAITGATSYTVAVPLSTFGLTGTETECHCKRFHVAAHAVVVKDTDGDGAYDKNETAWGAGKRFSRRGSWATYLSPASL